MLQYTIILSCYHLVTNLNEIINTIDKNLTKGGTVTEAALKFNVRHGSINHNGPLATVKLKYTTTKV